MSACPEKNCPNQEKSIWFNSKNTAVWRWLTKKAYGKRSIRESSCRILSGWWPTCESINAIIAGKSQTRFCSSGGSAPPGHEKKAYIRWNCRRNTFSIVLDGAWHFVFFRLAATGFLHDSAKSGGPGFLILAAGCAFVPVQFVAQPGAVPILGWLHDDCPFTAQQQHLGYFAGCFVLCGQTIIPETCRLTRRRSQLDFKQGHHQKNRDRKVDSILNQSAPGAFAPADQHQASAARKEHGHGRRFGHGLGRNQHVVN